MSECTLKKDLALVEAADQALERIHEILLQMRELAFLAADPQADSRDRILWDAEFQRLSAELDLVAAQIPDLSFLESELAVEPDLLGDELYLTAPDYHLGRLH